jgi:CHAT domain-containing protein/tetratricopeptide (TPR) repeat protein
MRIVRLAVCVLLSLAAACERTPPRALGEERCLTVDRQHPASLTFTAPADGTVSIGIEPRGIAIVARAASSAPSLPATSPVERLGMVRLVETVRAGEVVRLHVESRDWPGIRGEVCVQADLLARADRTRTRAERAFAKGGEATLRRAWVQAFDGYAEAAQAYASLDLEPLAGAAYHAMGELAHARLGREAEAPVFAARARKALGEATPMEVGALLSLEARAALESRDVSRPSAAREVTRLISEARAALAAQPYGAREAARLGLVEGFLAFRTGAPEVARVHFETVMRQCASLGDWECHAGAAQNIAALAEEAESYRAALDAYAAAVRFLDAAVAPELEADVWDNYGRLQRVVGLVMASKTSHDNALRLYAELRNCDGVRRTLARSGALHAQVGSLEDAADELHRAASLGCEALFTTLASRGSPEEARPARGDARSCDGFIDPRDLSADGSFAVLQAVLALHATMQLSGDHEEAARCAAQAKRYAGTARGRVRTANASGETFIEQRRPAEARSAFQAAHQEAEAAELPASNEHRSRTLLGLARTSLADGKAAQAHEHSVRALRAASARADVEQTVDALRVLAASERAMREPELAARTLQVAMRLVEQVPIHELSADVRATYLSAQHAVFAELTELTASVARNEKQTAQAFALAERGRARSFKYAVSQTTEKPARGDAGSTPYRALLARLASASEKADADAAQLIAGVAEALTPDDSFETTDLAAVQKRLRELDAVLVQYAAGPSDLFAFVVDPHRITVHRLGARDAIATAAGDLLERIRGHDATAANVRDAARTLARSAWWPLTERITTKRVLIAPDDALHLVPFAALPWSRESGELTLQRTETAVVPSGTFVATGKRARAGRSALRSFALLGDPVFRSAAWRARCVDAETLVHAPARGTAWEYVPSLPASRDEVAGIATLVRAARPDTRIDTLVGCEATAQALKRAAAAQSGVLHIATHGRIDARRPRLSALAVTPAATAPDDASFDLLEILHLDLAARLVTLSACDTSRGRLLDGEGVLAPAQAFLEAGAATVVASMWRVEDAATARFMQAFYRRLLDRNMSAAAALRSTQLEEQSRGASYSWAAFGIYGRPDTQI